LGVKLHEMRDMTTIYCEPGAYDMPFVG